MQLLLEESPDAALRTLEAPLSALSEAALPKHVPGSCIMVMRLEARSFVSSMCRSPEEASMLMVGTALYILRVSQDQIDVPARRKTPTHLAVVADGGRVKTVVDPLLAGTATTDDALAMFETWLSSAGERW